MGAMKALVPARSAADQTARGSNAIAMTSRVQVPAVIQNGIQDLLVGFQAGTSNQPAEDRVRSLQIYARACSEFESFIVERALQHLLFHNPRNPFPPTPQDVHEACAKMQADLKDVVLRFFAYGEDWPTRSSHVRSLGDAIPALDPTFSIVPRPLIIDWLRQHFSALDIDRQMSNFLQKTFQEFKHCGMKGFIALPLFDVRDDRFALIPREAFSDRGYELTVKAREQLKSFTAQKKADDEAERQRRLEKRVA